MTLVLVHGNPETEAIWDDLVPHLRGQHHSSFSTRIWLCDSSRL